MSASKAKNDLMREIIAKVARKKEVAKQVSRQKTVANWVAEFFIELEKVKKMDPRSPLIYLSIKKLAGQIQTLDRRAYVDLRFDDASGQDVIEISWSDAFVLVNNCEKALVLDASSALFQSAMEDV
jgi:hypothetical protein